MHPDLYYLIHQQRERELMASLHHRMDRRGARADVQRAATRPVVDRGDRPADRPGARCASGATRGRGLLPGLT